ncbi:MAG: SpoIID/LytB domain-containing protein [Candidatus Hydrogenedentes bacterium]|nr:SpoIID/LytB domain-containing protein [Candidatus Hydrogenedentota bacterium]
MAISSARLTAIRRWACLSGTLFILCGCAHTGLAGPPPERPAKPAIDRSITVAVQYGIAAKSLSLHTQAPAVLLHGKERIELEAGAWTVSIETKRLPKTRFSVYAKAFLSNEDALLQAYLGQMRQQGFQPEVHVFGRHFEGLNGADADNRQYWVALGIFDRESSVAPLKAQLGKQSIWAWHREEKRDEGVAVMHLRRDGAPARTIALPAAFEGTGEVALRFEGAKEALRVGGDFQFAQAMKGGLEAVATLEIERYLKGVLPYEMPASWPVEALKAQAVAARSEVLANLAGKHKLEGFDFCTKEHCRVYGGFALQGGATDAALADTRGAILVSEGRAVPTVFSANCGGWTENNDTVWAGPAQATLRGRYDGDGKAPYATLGSESAVKQWVGGAGSAWCADASANHRWTRDFSAAELSVAVNKSHAVGTVRQVTCGNRGVSGRLKSVQIKGDKGTVTVEKELPIRRALGGLPSALFTVSTWKDKAGGLHFRFQGAGRGHGVGLCQAGAKGMSLKGGTYSAILSHYFTGIELQRLY